MRLHLIIHLGGGNEVRPDHRGPVGHQKEFGYNLKGKRNLPKDFERRSDMFWITLALPGEGVSVEQKGRLGDQFHASGPVLRPFPSLE